MAWPATKIALTWLYDVTTACNNKYITKLILFIQRYISILRRNTQFIKYSLAAATFAYSFKQRFHMLSGDIERDLSLVTTAKIGAIHDPKFTAGALLARLESYRDSMRYNILSVRDSNTVARLETAIDSLKTDVSDGSLRKQPFCVVLYGFPGTGKSSFAIQIARALMNDRYGTFNASDMVTLNETDQYQSEFRTSHKVVLFDDIGASKHGLADTQNPWRKVIDFVNNIKKTALNPNVEMKGRVFIEPDVVILTTNLDMADNSTIWSYIPAGEAIFRRFSVVYQVVSHTHVRFLDIRPAGSRPGIMSHNVDAQLDLALLSRADAIETMRALFKEHMNDQTEFVQYFNSYFDDLKVGENTIVCESQAGPGYSPQAGDKEKKEFEEDFRAKRYVYLEEYYYRFVKWDAYFADHANFKSSYDGYGLTENGYVHLRFQENLIYIHAEPFNSALARWADGRSLLLWDDRQSVYPTGLRAESKTVFKTQGSEDDSSGSYVSQDVWPIISNLMSSKFLLDPGKKQFEKRKLLSALCLFDSPCFKNKPPAYTLRWCWIVCLIELAVTRFGIEKHVIISFLVNPLGSYFEGSRNKRKNQMQTYHGYAVNHGFSIGKEYSGPDVFDGSSQITEDDVHDDPSYECCYTAAEVYDFEELQDSTCAQSEESLSFNLSETADSLCSHLSESEHLDRLIDLVRTMAPSIPNFWKNVGIASFGEIDLVIRVDNSYLVIEQKSTETCLKKGRKQALRYSNTLLALYPSSRVVGMLYSPQGLEVVCDHNPENSDSLSDFLSVVSFFSK